MCYSWYSFGSYFFSTGDSSIFTAKILIAGRTNTNIGYRYTITAKLSRQAIVISEVPICRRDTRYPNLKNHAVFIPNLASAANIMTDAMKTTTNRIPYRIIRNNLLLLVPDSHTAHNGSVEATGLQLHPSYDIRLFGQLTFGQESCGKGFGQHIEVGTLLFVQQGHQPLEVLLRLGPYDVVLYDGNLHASIVV